MQRDQLGDLAAFVSPARRGASPRRLSGERLLRTLRPALEEIDAELAVNADVSGSFPATPPRDWRRRLVTGGCDRADQLFSQCAA